MQTCESSLIKLSGVIQVHCLWIKNLKKGQNNFKREKLYFLLLIALISLSGFMWGHKSFQSELISPNNIKNSKNHDLIRNVLSNDLEEKQLLIKPINRRTTISNHRFSIEESQEYNESSPIIIDGNSDFINQANLYNWTGDGNYSTPYNITNLNITANDVNVNPIDIRNTNLSFQISNCLLQSGRYGIYLNNASHGSVFNTIIRNNARYGIDLNLGQTTTLSKLVLLDNIWGGIHIGSSNNTSLLDINCTNNANYGIVIYSSKNNTLSNIHAYSNKGTGISVSNSEKSDFSAIFCRNNEGPGLFLHYSNYSSLLDITCVNNSGTGLLISGSLYCDITHGSFSNNTMDGLELEYSNETSISFSNFSNNSYNGIDLSYSHHFILTNLSIIYNGYNNGYEGLKVSTAFNGSFLNIICRYNDGDGFEAVDIENSVVSSCKMVNNSDSGISFYRSNKITFSQNTITNNSFGPYFWKGGFYIEDSNNCTISYNYIFRNSGEGLELLNTNGTVITFNAIYKNENNGISIGSTSMRNRVTNNIIYNNAYTAIYGDSSYESITDLDKNIITGNDFIDNKEEFSQVRLYGSNFDVHHNYWDDLQPLDEDEDGIVDNPYLLRWDYEEDVGIYDEFPLAEPTNIPTIHYLTTPFLLYPRSIPPPEFSDQEFEPEWQEIIYNGTVRIQWVDPIDSENHPVSISILYARAYDENWIELISGVEISYYDWDTTKLANGYLQLRIIATCTHGESTMDTDHEMIQVDNSPPVITDLQASPFSPILYVIFGLMIGSISMKLNMRKSED